MRTGCVYLARNLINGRCYIGKSKMGLAARQRIHERLPRNAARMPFSCALRKYGAHSFAWCELYLSDDDRALVSAEVSIIGDYRAAGVSLYNVTDGGDGLAGRKRPEAEIQAMRGRVVSGEQRAKLRAGWTPERRAAQADKMRNRVISASTRAKSSASRTGKGLSDTTRAKISQAKSGASGAQWTDERRMRQAATIAAREPITVSEQHRERIALGSKAWADANKERVRAAGKAGAAARWGKI